MLVRRYLRRVKQAKDVNVQYQPLPGSRRAGSQYVRLQFPRQVAACRSKLGKGTKCLLIVVVDADNLSALERRESLQEGLAQSGISTLKTEEPIVLLIPKWQIETWIKCLLGQSMEEDDRDSDRPPVDVGQIKAAAANLYDWSRPGAHAGATCVPSLRAALPEWKRIG